MSVDFAEAAQRHWTDAELLHARQRWPNADQLYGVAAECSLKAVMQALGMQLAPDGSPQGKYKVHIDKLWAKFQVFAQGTGASTYAAMLPTVNPFLDWRVDQRYWHSSEFAHTKVQPHRQGSIHAKKLLNQARQDGMVQ